jgi:hypothetical protein
MKGRTFPLYRDLYVEIILDRYEVPLIALTIALHRGLYFAIIMDRYEGPHTVLIVYLIKVYN